MGIMHNVVVFLIPNVNGFEPLIKIKSFGLLLLLLLIMMTTKAISNVTGYIGLL